MTASLESVCLNMAMSTLMYEWDVSVVVTVTGLWLDAAIVSWRWRQVLLREGMANIDKHNGQYFASKQGARYIHGSYRQKGA